MTTNTQQNTTLYGFVYMTRNKVTGHLYYDDGWLRGRIYKRRYKP